MLSCADTKGEAGRYYTMRKLAEYFGDCSETGWCYVSSVGKRPSVIPNSSLRWSRESQICCPTELSKVVKTWRKCVLKIKKAPDKKLKSSLCCYKMQSFGCPSAAENCSWDSLNSLTWTRNRHHADSVLKIVDPGASNRFYFHVHLS